VRWLKRWLVCAGVLAGHVADANDQSVTPVPGSALQQGAATGSGLSAQGSAIAGAGSSLSASESGLNAIETELGTAFRLSGDLLFDFDRADLKPAAMPMLQALLDAIHSKQPKQVQIHGHTDSRGSDSYNLTLSRKRADAVAAWLQQQGVSASLLSSAGFGESAPAVPNEKPDGADDPDGRQNNRRVDILLAKAFVAVKPIKVSP
jgi:outer membrane protein OmpA-like peptidoglycan-associated protein